MVEDNDHFANTLSPTAYVLYRRLGLFPAGLHLTEIDLPDLGELEQQGLVRLEEVTLNGRDMIKAVLYIKEGL